MVYPIDISVLVGYWKQLNFNWNYAHKSFPQISILNIEKGAYRFPAFPLPMSGVCPINSQTHYSLPQKSNEQSSPQLRGGIKLRNLLFYKYG
jgi:hypothetical protein